MSDSRSRTSDSGDFPGWIGRARAGSAEDLGRVLEYCRHYLLRVANQELDADIRAKVGASDLVQQTFLQAAESFPAFRGNSEAELLAWLRRILERVRLNVDRHHKKAQKRTVGREVSLEAAGSEACGRLEPVADTHTPSSRLGRQEQAEALETALACLPESYRQVITWHHREQLTFAEIGKRLGRSADAARKLWSRALQRLQEELAPDESRRDNL